MSPAAPARSRSGRGPVDTAAPAARIISPPSTWPRDSSLVALLTVVVAGVAVITGRPLFGVVVVLLGAGLVAGVARHGRLGSRRGQVRDRCVEALAPLLRTPTLDRGTVVLTRWPRGATSSPQYVRVRYSPLAEDDEPGWAAQVCRVLQRRLQQEYAVARHDREHLVLDLQASTTVLPSRAIQRAERVIAEVFGSSARLADPQLGDPQLGDLRLEVPSGAGGGSEVISGFTVRHDVGVKVAVPQARARLERVVATMLPGRWRADWDLERDTVRFEHRPVMPRSVPHAAPHDPHPTRLPIAVGEDGQVIEWDLRGTGPHAMVAGKTGTGKTVALHGIVHEAAFRAYPIWVVDGKRVEFLGLRGWPNVQIVATETAEQIALINRAWQLMEDRYAQIEGGLVDEDNFQPLILVLDEYRDFVSNATEFYAGLKVSGMPAKCPVFAKVDSLARKARTARIHLLMGTQRPDNEWLGGETRDNFSTRMSLGRLSPQGSMMMWESYTAGVSIPARVPGRSMAASCDGSPVEAQAFWTPDPRKVARTRDAADMAILAGLRPAHASHPWLQLHIEEPDPEEHSDKTLAWAQWNALLNGELQECPAPAPAGLRPVGVSAGRPGHLLALPTRPTAATPNQPEAANNHGLGLDHEQQTGDQWNGDQWNGDQSNGDLWDEDQDVLDELTDGDGGTDEKLDGLGLEDLDGYGTPTPRRSADLLPGDLVLLEGTGWVTVESAEADITGGDEVCLDWRSDIDDAGSLSLSDSEPLMSCRPFEDVPA